MDLTDSNLPSVTTHSDEKSNKADSHKRSVKSHATRVFQESSIGIVSSIFTTHSKSRKFFKVFISSLCMAGFIYHFVTFLNHVFEYPEVVNISRDRSMTYIWPAYTYCHNNLFGRSAFCSSHPEYCVKPVEEFCKAFPSFCGANATIIPKRDYEKSFPYEFQYAWVLKYGSVPNVLNISNSVIKRRGRKEIDEEISGPYLRTTGYRENPRACYSIHSLVDNKRHPLQKERDLGRSSEPSPDESIRFRLNETEMMNPRGDVGIYFSVHSPFEAVNPLRDGIFLRGGRTYYIYVQMEEESLLKEPFESNCMDYEELWKKNNRVGPRTKKMCQDICHLGWSLEEHRCALTATLYPHKELICYDHRATNHSISKPAYVNTWSSRDECIEHCRDECRSLNYRTRYSSLDLGPYVNGKEYYRHIEVKIFLSNDEVKVLRHSPKYETVDVISSIGGFLGCWLGVALMDILDVFGSIITVCRFACRKRLSKDDIKTFVQAP